jgi:choline-sulfatase
MYEESVALPFIMAGPDVPAGKVVETPISLLDCHPTILEAVGADPGPGDDKLPGRSLWSMAQGSDEERTVFSEYHAVGSRNALYMLRNRQFKYIHYVHEPAQLFDLTIDPQEENNLATSPDHQVVLQKFEQELRSLLDPEGVDTEAKADQWTKIEAFGGREAVLKRGSFDNSPVPGERPAFKTYE